MGKFFVIILVIFGLAIQVPLLVGIDTPMKDYQAVLIPLSWGLWGIAYIIHRIDKISPPKDKGG